MYISWYGFGRMLIEGLRTDSLYVGVFRISQVVGFICFIVGSLLLTLNLLKARRAALTAKEYSAAYPKFATTASMEATEDSAEQESQDADNDVDDNTDEADADEDKQEDEPQDVSEKVQRLFGTDTNNKE